MRVTDSDIARIPVANLRVPRVEFAALWAIVLIFIAIRGGGAISLDRVVGREL